MHCSCSQISNLRESQLPIPVLISVAISSKHMMDDAATCLWTAFTTNISDTKCMGFLPTTSFPTLQTLTGCPSIQFYSDTIKRLPLFQMPNLQMGFYGGLITQAPLLNSWALVINSISRTSPIPRGWGRSFGKSQPSNHRVGSCGNQPPWQKHCPSFSQQPQVTSLA